MKITRKDPVMAEFSTISIGEVFKDTSGNILMRIQYIDVDGGPDVNAIELETGASVYFYGDDIITPLRAELIVE